MMEVFREFTFEAAHAIPPYSNVHGHSFSVEVVMRGDPDPVYGWVESLTDIDPSVSHVQRLLDHKFLNEIDGLQIPSLENVAHWIWRQLEADIPCLHRIVVRRGHAGHSEGCTLVAPVEA